MEPMHNPVEIERNVRHVLNALMHDVSGSTSGAELRHVELFVASAYTAFDGDDFYFTELFSAHAFGLNYLPVNPEAFLGYKQAVDALHTKRRVLASDVALLAKADELWVYTRQRAESPHWPSMAEGVLVEALYWLTLAEVSGIRRPLKFVDLDVLIFSDRATPREVDVTASEMRGALCNSHPEVLDLVESFFAFGAVPLVATAVYAMADSKNAHWVREWILSQGWAPIVPTLAFPSATTRSAADLAAAWVWSIRQTDLLLRFDPLNFGLNSPRLPQALMASIGDESAEKRDARCITGDWSIVGAPKAVLREAWPITARERDQLARGLSSCREATEE